MFDASRIYDLLQQVPQPPEDSLPSGIANSDLDDFQGRTGIHLPSGMQSWLRLTNGPCVGPGGLYGIHTSRSNLDIEGYLEIFPNWKAKKWIPVAGDGCGNYYVIPTQHEFGDFYPVLFVDTSKSFDSPSYVVASDLEHFLIAILSKELGATEWPFNNEYVTRFDPQITKCHGVDLPWTAD
jgi:cell wall assembly regulator SMI1